MSSKCGVESQRNFLTVLQETHRRQRGSAELCPGNKVQNKSQVRRKAKRDGLALQYAVFPYFYS